MPERDPVRITIEGSNDPQANNFNLLYEGPSGLDHDPDRTQWGKPVTFANTTPYKTYRVLVTATRANADAAQYAEVKLGVALSPPQNSPAPKSQISTQFLILAGTSPLPPNRRA